MTPDLVPNLSFINNYYNCPKSSKQQKAVKTQTNTDEIQSYYNMGRFLFCFFNNSSEKKTSFSQNFQTKIR